MTVITLSSQPPVHPHLRRFDLRRDLAQVANLIELCFSDTLDDDGRQYIHRMRATARQSALLFLAAAAQDRAPAPFSGFIWEDDGCVIGNLSHFPMPARGKKIYLIANVAVHPDFRRRGIARAMTEAALEYSHERKADATWLHVRDDNPAAFDLYRSLGFEERARRTQWTAKSLAEASSPLVGLVVGPRRREHWLQQAHWFRQMHPAALDWYFPFHLNTFRPGLAGLFYRLLHEVKIMQWAATWQEQLLGVLVWQRSHGITDRLWLATPPEFEETAIPALISHARWEFPARRRVSLEFPAGRGESALTEMGFSPEQTLIWMEYQG